MHLASPSDRNSCGGEYALVLLRRGCRWQRAQRSSRDCRSSTSDGVCGRPSLSLRSLSQSRRKASLRRCTGAVPDSSLRRSSMIASLCALRTLDTIIHKAEDNRSCQGATTPILSTNAARTTPDVTNGHPALSHWVDHSGAVIRVAAAGNSHGTDIGNSVRRNGQRVDAIQNARSHGGSGSNHPTNRWTIAPRIRPTADTDKVYGDIARDRKIENALVLKVLTQLSAATRRSCTVAAVRRLPAINNVGVRRRPDDHQSHPAHSAPDAGICVASPDVQRRRRAAAPSRPRPASIMAQLSGSGTTAEGSG